MEGRGSDYASSANATAYNAKIAVFLCPSDPKGGIVNDNCYYASVGPTTNAGSDTPPRPTSPVCPNFSDPTSGVFAFRLAYGLARYPRRLVEHDRVLRGQGGDLAADRRPGQHDHERGPLG